MRSEYLTISIVIPVYSGKNYLTRLSEKINTVQKKYKSLEIPVKIQEVIFVDDGSKDGSNSLIKSLLVGSENFHLVELSRNFGQHPATVAGILRTSSDWVITIDEDLQHDPDHIIDLLAHAICNDLDIVYAHPKRSVHKQLYRNLSSILFKKLVAKISGNKFVSEFNSFRCIRGSVARAAASVVNKNSYYDVVLTWFTNEIESIEFNMQDIRSTEMSSNYNIYSLIRHAKRLILSAGFTLSKSIGVMSLIVGMVSFIFGLFILFGKLFNPANYNVPGWTSVYVTIAFGFATVLMVLSLFQEQISQLSQKAHGIPTYFVVNRSIDGNIRKYFNKWKS
jgi:glycosyltransferase involved in cell wall biosynthesis